MSAEVKKKIELEIAHVLFIDIVGYSKFSITTKRRQSMSWRRSMSRRVLIFSSHRSG
jgi:hypothetical protein